MVRGRISSTTSEGMGGKPKKHHEAIRALALLMAIWFSSAAMPAALIPGGLDGCGMAHCEEEGECCCLVNLAVLKERQSSGEPIAGAPEILTGCPVDCCQAGGTQGPARHNPERKAWNAQFDFDSRESAALEPVRKVASRPPSAACPRGPPLLSS